jgi:hypothetical protein
VSDTRRTTSTTTTNNNTKLVTKLFLMSTPGAGTLFPLFARKRPAEGEAERAAQRLRLGDAAHLSCYACDGEEEPTAAALAAAEEPAAAAPRRQRTHAEANAARASTGTRRHYRRSERYEAASTPSEGHATLFGGRDVTQFKTIKFDKEFCNDLAAGKPDTISTYCSYMTAGLVINNKIIAAGKTLKIGLGGPDRVSLYHCHEASAGNNKYYIEDGWDRIQPAFAIALDVDIPFVVVKQIAELLPMPLWKLCRAYDSKVLRGTHTNKTLRKGASPKHRRLA